MTKFMQCRETARTVLHTLNRISVVLTMPLGLLALIIEFVGVPKFHMMMGRLRIPMTDDRLMILCGVCLAVMLISYLILKRMEYNDQKEQDYERKKRKETRKETKRKKHS